MRRWGRIARGKEIVRRWLDERAANEIVQRWTDEQNEKSPDPKIRALADHNQKVSSSAG